MTDKNGTKIFEGDILKFAGKNLLVWWNWEEFQWQARAVEYPKFKFTGMREPGIVYDNIDFGWIHAEIPICGRMTTEIIGNIYDNPELLEKSDE